jgi:DNA-binding XRE family transcriptional regulator
MVYTSVDGYYALHKTPPSKFSKTYKIPRSTKTFVREKNKPVMTDLCYDLIQKRHSMNMTQYGASQVIGVSQATYHNWEAGKVRPRAKQLNNILEFLYS